MRFEKGLFQWHLSIRLSTTVLRKGAAGFPGGTLYCKCPTDKVAVQIASDIVHNHACGCSKCWKPAGALFSVIGVVPVANVKVTAHPEKLAPVDPSPRRSSATPARPAASHMYGRIEKDHPFKGLDFVHAELSSEKPVGRNRNSPRSARRSSSRVSSRRGWMPSARQFKSVGLSTYDCLSPALDGRHRRLHRDEGGRRPTRKPPPRRRSPHPRSAPPPPAKKGFFARLFGG